MKLEVRLFGPLRPCAPGSVILVEIEDGATAGAAREAVARALETAGAPGARGLVARAVLATEDELLSDDAPLGATVRSLALLPPVCGG